MRNGLVVKPVMLYGTLSQTLQGAIGPLTPRDVMHPLTQLNGKLYYSALLISRRMILLTS